MLKDTSQKRILYMTWYSVTGPDYVNTRTMPGYIPSCWAFIYIKSIACLTYVWRFRGFLIIILLLLKFHAIGDVAHIFYFGGFWCKEACCKYEPRRSANSPVERRGMQMQDFSETAWGRRGHQWGDIGWANSTALTSHQEACWGYTFTEPPQKDFWLNYI